MNFLLLVLAMISVSSAVSKKPQFSSIQNVWRLKKISLAENVRGIIDPHWQMSGERDRPYYWKTHPIVNRQLTQIVILESSSKTKLWSALNRLYKWKTHRNMDFIVLKKVLAWMNFSVIRSCSWSGKLKFFKNCWMRFPGFVFKG